MDIGKGGLAILTGLDTLDDVNTFDHLGSLVAKNALESPLSHRLESGLYTTHS